MTQEGLAIFLQTVILYPASGVVSRKWSPATWFGKAKVPWLRRRISPEIHGAIDVRMK